MSKKEKDLKYLWFNEKDSPLLEKWPLSERDNKYYVNTFYEKIVFNLPIPDEGYIVVLGTHNCVSFDKLCQHYGYERCIGYDLFNPRNHPRVIIKDCFTLSKDDDIPIAFCHNDLGAFWITPELKVFGQKWSARNIVKAGYYLGNNNYNRARIDVEKIMIDFGFENTNLLDLCKKPAFKNNLPESRIDGYMVSKKL